MQTTETKSKHTPGGWIVYPFKAFVLPADRLDPDDAPICAMLWPTDKRSEEETQANARLVAAAPELLEALRNLVGLAEMRGSLHEYRAALDEARAAIAKATGGA